MYEDSEIAWLEKRAGCITASELSNLMSASNKFTQGNISYLYSLQRQRHLNRPKRSVDSPALRFGRENEKYCYEWMCVNFPENNYVYVGDYPKEQTFIKNGEWFGCTPDSFKIRGKSKPKDWDSLLRRKKSIVEYKCVYGELETNKMFSPTLPYVKKKQMVIDEHLWQIVAQFIGCPDVELIEVLKYCPMHDDDFFDDIDPLDPSRGIIFSFSRKNMGECIDLAKKRCNFANWLLEAEIDLELADEYWQKLIEKEKENEKTQSSV